MELKTFDLGLVDYRKASDFQTRIFSEVKDGRIEAAVIFSRKYPVVTMGRTARASNIRVSESELRSRGIEIIRAARGGDVTYHGPGQVVVYPVIPLRFFGNDIRLFLKTLEEIVIRILKDFGILAKRIPGARGVWVEGNKISSIGIGIRQWITCHGVALNVKEDDLANFSFIRPCGMDVSMTSMETVLKKKISIEEVKPVIEKHTRGFLSFA